MIQAIGGKFVYVYLLIAVRGSQVSTQLIFDVADSDEEAYGRAMKIATAKYPKSNGYNYHDASYIKVSDLENVSKIDISKLVPES